jgi:alkylation response protein AidB-like acyl-CoA dehydrogenase
VADLEAFRAEVSAWAEQHCPASQRQPAVSADIYRGGREAAFPSEDARIWFEAMLERGWTVPDWPEAYGGAGLDAAHTKVLRAELKRLGCRMPLSGLGVWMLGPALLEFGTEAQKAEHLPRIARGEIRWCQGYSEPGAGSDLASLQCRAVEEGEHFRINGTKIWTSDADKSDWMFCLVRTDPEAPKHEGISFLLLDMAQEQVSVSPIQLISGDSDFCQTFIDGALARKSDLVGGLNQGWRVAKRLLQHERKLMSELAELAVGPKMTPLDCAREYVGQHSDGRLRSPLLRDRLARYEMDNLALQLSQRRVFEQARSGQPDTRAPMYFKYYASEQDKVRGELILALMGQRGLGWSGEQYSAEELALTRKWAHSKILTIAGGSSEIQLNVIAKRVLGLPD